MDYRQSTEFLLSLPDMERSSHGVKSRTMSLDCMRALLARLGNPQLARKTVHITGSKGKGSTSAFIASGIRMRAPVSLYTSPHLHSYRERICLDLQAVTAGDFAAGVTAIKDAVLAQHESSLGPVSTFGAMTSLFFYLSRLHQMQWQVVEVGLGGLYDGTNVFDRKEMAVMTAVSLEHTNILGKTTREIAENKAGIITTGAKVVLAKQKDRRLRELIADICRQRQASLIDLAEYSVEQLNFSENEQSFRVRRAGKSRLFSISMLGEHQIDNALTAIAALDNLFCDDPLSDEEIQLALGRVSLPGRLELISRKPLVLIDGAHNGESAAVLGDALSRHFSCKSAVFVLGTNSDKRIDEIISSLKPFCKKLIASRSKSEKAMDPVLIAGAAFEQGLECELIENLEQAVERAMDLAGCDGVVCATGSLYLVAEIREYFLGEDPDWSLLKSPVQTAMTANETL